MFVQIVFVGTSCVVFFRGGGEGGTVGVFFLKISGAVIDFCGDFFKDFRSGIKLLKF